MCPGLCIQRLDHIAARAILTRPCLSPYPPAPSPYPATPTPDVIKDPIALDVMEERLASDCFYATLDIFNSDLRRIFENCRFCNAPDTIYYKLANKLESLVNQYLAAHVLFDDDPGRT